MVEPSIEVGCRIAVATLLVEDAALAGEGTPPIARLEVRDCNGSWRSASRIIPLICRACMPEVSARPVNRLRRVPSLPSRKTVPVAKRSPGSREIPLLSRHTLQNLPVVIVRSPTRGKRRRPYSRAHGPHCTGSGSAAVPIRS